MRFWLIDLPALIIKSLFLYYWFLLAAITVLNLLNASLYLTAWAWGSPLLWAK